MSPSLPLVYFTRAESPVDTALFRARKGFHWTVRPTSKILSIITITHETRGAWKMPMSNWEGATPDAAT